MLQTPYLGATPKSGRTQRHFARAGDLPLPAVLRLVLFDARAANWGVLVAFRELLLKVLGDPTGPRWSFAGFTDLVLGVIGCMSTGFDIISKRYAPISATVAAGIDGTA